MPNTCGDLAAIAHSKANKGRCSLSTETIIGIISMVLVAASSIPYGFRVGQGKIQANQTTWGLWTLIGLALLVTYRSSGAEANILPAIFGLFNPLLITIIVLIKRGGWKKPKRLEVYCLIFGAVSLSVWLGVHESKEAAQYALYLAILADFCAALPTVSDAWKKPEDDRPFAWTLYAFGFGLAIFAIEEHTFANYALPLYMFAMALIIAFPLARYRWKNKKPLSEWA